MTYYLIKYINHYNIINLEWHFQSRDSTGIVVDPGTPVLSYVPDCSKYPKTNIKKNTFERRPQMKKKIWKYTVVKTGEY